MTDDPDNWTTRKDAANIAGVTVRTLERWIEAGRVRAWRRNARCVFVWVPDVDAMFPPVSQNVVSKKLKGTRIRTPNTL